MATLKFGNPSGTEFDVKCKSGSYINNFYGVYDRYIEKLGATCSDGKDLGSIGRSFGIIGKSNTSKEIKVGSEAPGGPYNTFTMGSDGRLIKFNKLAGSSTISQAVTQTCPTGAAVGIGGTYDGTYITSLSIQCEAPSSYCYNHIEDPMCKDADKDSLNMSCATKWTKACNTRVRDLNEALVATYCKRNPKDPICSCYIDAPNYIPPKLRQMPQCWNAECSAHGYIPSSAGHSDCPKVTIGSNDLKGVNVDTLSSNIKIGPGDTPVKAVNEISDSTILIFILICVGCFIGLATYIWYYYVRIDKHTPDPNSDPDNIQLGNQGSTSPPVGNASVDNNDAPDVAEIEDGDMGDAHQNN